MGVVGLSYLRAADQPALGEKVQSLLGWRLAVIAGLLVAIIPTVLWPGDSLWFWDEPMEMHLALQANQEHRLAQFGLAGSFPFPYGALGIQLDQLWLLFTHDPRALVVIHALFCAVPTAIALFWLSRTLGLNPWFAVAVLASPHLWMEARRLWQPSFCIPLGALAVAAHASFLKTRSAKSLMMAVAFAIAPLFVHLQCLPLTLAILGHLAWQHREALSRHRRGLLAVLAGFGCLHAPYVIVAGAIILAKGFSFVRAGHNSNTPLAMAWWGPVLGGRLFAGWDWVRLGEPRWEKLLRIISSIAIPIVWAGIALAIWRYLQSRHERRPLFLDDEAQRRPPALRKTILLLCLAGFAIHVALCTLFRLASVHHYFFGTFGIYVVLAWMAVEELPNAILRATVIGIYGASVGLMTLLAIAHVHQDSWAPWLSPTLSDQIALVRRLDHYADRWAYTDVSAFRERPSVLWCLQRLIGPPAPGERTYSGRLFIRRRSGANGEPTSRIDLVESTDLPANATLIPLDSEHEAEVKDVEAIRAFVERSTPDVRWRIFPHRVRSEAIDTAFVGWRYYLAAPEAGERRLIRLDSRGKIERVDVDALKAGAMEQTNPASARILEAAIIQLKAELANEHKPSDPGLSVQHGILMNGGKEYRAIGANYFSLFSRILHDPSDHSSVDNLKRLEQSGIPFVRFMCGGFWPVEQKLYLTDREEYFRRLDLVVRAAEEAKIGLIPSLFWNYSTVSDLAGEPIDQLGNPSSKSIALIQRYTKDVVERYKDSTAIWGWEFGNEYNLDADLPNAKEHRPQIWPDLGTPGSRTEHDELKFEQMRMAMVAFAQAVRQIDPHRIILTGNAIPRSSAYHNWKEHSWKADSPEEFEQILLRDNPDPFDTITIHVYPDPDGKYPGGAKDMGALIQRASAAASRAGKALVVGEFGAPASLGPQRERAVYREMLVALENSRVPLGAFWVFDNPGQKNDWDVSFDNPRAYMIEDAVKANRH